jgi:hypothetical protein
MRSKWLDWPHVPEIIEKGPDAEPTKPSKAGSVGFVCATPGASPIIRPPRPADELPVADPYAERLQAAFRQISGPSYPPGMLLWLENADPEAYAGLTSRIPDELSMLWAQRAPLEQFEAVLARFIALHWRCREACVQARRRSKQEPLQMDFGKPVEGA